MQGLWAWPGRIALRVAAGVWALVAAAETVEFREPRLVAYEMTEAPITARSLAAGAPGPEWIPARRAGRADAVALGRRIVLRLQPGSRFNEFPELSRLALRRQVDERTWVLEAADAIAAAANAAVLSRSPGVEVAVPTIRRAWLRRHFPYAPRPDDRYFPLQTALQSPASPGAFLADGPDLNVRGAWPLGRGAGSDRGGGG